MKKTNNKNKKPLDHKVIFRKSKQWKDFRIKLKKKQNMACACHFLGLPGQPVGEFDEEHKKKNITSTIG